MGVFFSNLPLHSLFVYSYAIALFKPIMMFVLFMLLVLFALVAMTVMFHHFPMNTIQRQLYL